MHIFHLSLYDITKLLRSRRCKQQRKLLPKDFSIFSSQKWATRHAKNLCGRSCTGKSSVLNNTEIGIELHDIGVTTTLTECN